MPSFRTHLKRVISRPRLAIRDARAALPPLVELARSENRGLRPDLRLRPSGALPAADRAEALKAGVEWLQRSVNAGEHAGSRCYWLGEGWSPCYPEVTGYNSITLFDYAREYSDTQCFDSATRMCDWLLTVQDACGGFQGGYIGLRNKEPVVFNTAQILHGLLKAHAETRAQRYLDAAVHAGDWLVSVQDRDGAWRTGAYLGAHRTTDTLIALPLAKLWQATGREVYRAAAERSVRNAMGFQTGSGWFANCDNSLELVDRPVTHTLAYTVEGLVETGALLSLPDVFEAGRRSAEAMADAFLQEGMLWGRYFDGWRPAARYVCLTGCAQTARNCLFVFAITRNQRLLDAAVQLNDYLCAVQHTKAVNDAIRGAIAGSSPLQGEYMRFKFPSWATKYFCDSLMREHRARQSTA